jgi:hypothetical protein
MCISWPLFVLVMCFAFALKSFAESVTAYPSTSSRAGVDRVCSTVPGFEYPMGLTVS